ncbi:hypothetical protein ACHAXS_009195, partial [Conticribra weissflogii]
MPACIKKGCWMEYFVCIVLSGRLRLDKGSISNGKSDGKGHDARNEPSSISDDNTLINVSGLCGKRCHSGSKSSNGGSI